MAAAESGLLIRNSAASHISTLDPGSYEHCILSVHEKSVDVGDTGGNDRFTCRKKFTQLEGKSGVGKGRSTLVMQGISTHSARSSILFVQITFEFYPAFMWG